MCHFITAIVPGSADRESLERIFHAHRLAFSVIGNPHVASQLAAGDLQVCTTQGHCDCDTVLGSHRRIGNRKPGTRELAKLRTKGWSEAKIQRWLEQREGVAQRDERSTELRARASLPEAERWVAFINDALTKTPYFGLLLHMYSGGLDTERIDLKRRRTPRGKLSADFLLSIEEDVLYEFER
jgi:hypothetical protein